MSKHRGGISSVVSVALVSALVVGCGDDGNTPKASVKYRFGDNLWYAVASKGYRYGGVNEGPPQSTFKSDSLWSYETGLRLAPAATLSSPATGRSDGPPAACRACLRLSPS